VEIYGRSSSSMSAATSCRNILKDSRNTFTEHLQSAAALGTDLFRRFVGLSPDFSPELRADDFLFGLRVRRRFL